MSYKLKMIVGFRRDQEHSIDIDEAHKAYYLFTHPDVRAIFSNGLAIKGSQIDEIIPDWQGTMGWNATHILDGDDWNEIHNSGVESRLRNLLVAAKEIAELDNPQDLNVPLTELLETKYPLLGDGKPQIRSGGMKSIGEIKKLP
jgi:hypothetical protein